MSEVFFTSDLHLGHGNILSTCGRPFGSVEEMNEQLIENWNRKVSGDDVVYILGDFSYRSKEHVSCYLKRMNGRKHLIVGNHDYKWMKNVPEPEVYFESVCEMNVINVDKRIITLCHYPMFEWYMSRHARDQESSFSWLIHGHIHNSRESDSYKYIKENLPCALNAGVDINGFEPVTFDELLANNKRWYER